LADGGDFALETLLSGNQSLRSLNLSGNGLTDADADALSAVLSLNNHLYELDLSCNKFGELAGVRATKISLEYESNPSPRTRLESAVQNLSVNPAITPLPLC
jgi:Ran GTPase-activating protein (RanGAP) involved in mRNA processing and transport